MIRACVALLVVLGIGCGSPDDQSAVQRFTASDSAGIRILIHPAGPFSDTISPAPALSIGREGDPDYELFRVAAVGALSSGNVVVANGGTHELRFFGPDGSHLRTVGRRGDGPEEFGFLSAMWVRAGDTVTVKDSGRRRMVHIDSAGVFVRGTSFAADLAGEPDRDAICVFPSLMGSFADGTRLVSGWSCLRLKGADGMRTWPRPLLLARDSGIDTVAVVLGLRVWERGNPPTPRDSYAFLPMAAVYSFAISEDRLFISHGIDYEIEVFDGRGRLVGKVREDLIPEPITAADRSKYMEEQSELGRPHPSDVPFPPRFGAYSKLVLSHEGDLWARHQSCPGELQHRWTVFSPSGEQVWRVVLPDVRVHSVRNGRVYATSTDSLGIQTVAVFEVGRAW